MSIDDFRPVHPVSPVAAYIGGKRQLAAHLVSIIDEIPHDVYAEPFVGMGGIFLRRTSAPKAEVINDCSGDVATLFRILQRHYVPFMDMLRYQLTSRRDFDRLSSVDPSSLTDLERAARFLYLQRLSFGGKVAGRTFGVSHGEPSRFDVTKLEPLLSAVAERLGGVVIENLGFAEFIQRYDRPGVLFYLDPPYWGGEGDYGAGVFARSDFAALAEQLGSLKGTFILSINDTPEIRRTFAAFEQAEVGLTYTIGMTGPKDVKELIITPRQQVRAKREPELFDGGGYNRA